MELLFPKKISIAITSSTPLGNETPHCQVWQQSNRDDQGHQHVQPSNHHKIQPTNENRHKKKPTGKLQDIQKPTGWNLGLQIM